LALDVVDDVVRADEHARAALAAAAEGDHLVHHLLEGDLRHDGRTLAQRCRQRKRRRVRAPSPYGPSCRDRPGVRRHCRNERLPRGAMADDSIENRTFDQLAVGDAASLTRTITREDAAMLAVLAHGLPPADVSGTAAGSGGPTHSVGFPPPAPPVGPGAARDAPP